jgi:hypothetical protein
VGDDRKDKEDWRWETYAVILNDGQQLTSGHGDNEEAEGDQVRISWEKLEAVFFFDSSGKVKLRDDFLGVNVFKSRSKVDPGPRRCEFRDGAITTWNLIEPVSVLWSSRVWDANKQDFRNKTPAANGYSGPFEFVVTRGKKLAITGVKAGKRQMAWHVDPDYEDWTGRFENRTERDEPRSATSETVPTSERTGILLDFYPDSKVRPKSNPYSITITDLDGASPTVATTDRSGHVPRVTGKLDSGDGALTLTLDGRSDDTTPWNAQMWSGGVSCPVKGSEAGLGIDDASGAQKVSDGEALIWLFECDNLKLAPGESLVMNAADFGGMEEGEHAQFWRLVGSPGSSGAGSLLATGGNWSGAITIADGDQFALTGDGRLRSLTLSIVCDESPAPTR